MSRPLVLIAKNTIFAIKSSETINIINPNTP